MTFVHRDFDFQNIFLSLFILRERESGGKVERPRETERERERERERIPGRLCTVSSEPDMYVEPMNCDIMT